MIIKTKRPVQNRLQQLNSHVKPKRSIDGIMPKPEQLELNTIYEEETDIM